MGDYVRIYAQSSHGLTIGEIKAFISQGTYFENEPTYLSSLSDGDQWEGTFALAYDGDRGDRTFQCNRTTDQNFIQATLDEYMMYSPPLQDAIGTWDGVQQNLRTCQQFLTIKLPQDLLFHPDENINRGADEMLYELEMHLAERLNGVIVQTEERGEAFYDEDFVLIALLAAATDEG